MAGKSNSSIRVPGVSSVPPNQHGGIPNFATPKQIHDAMTGGTVPKGKK